MKLFDVRFGPKSLENRRFWARNARKDAAERLPNAYRHILAIEEDGLPLRRRDGIRETQRPRGLEARKGAGKDEFSCLNGDVL